MDADCVPGASFGRSGSDELMLAPPSCEALIFDCDGTLADSSSVHFAVIRQVVAAYGIAFERDWYSQHVGLSAAALLEAIHRRYDVRIRLREFESARRPLYETALDEVREIEPVVAVARLYRGKLPLAVASGGPRSVVERTLQILKIRELFDTVVTIDDVVHAKPAPDLFELAAKRLRISPGACVVYEDTDEGLEAARTAGMFPIDVRPALRSRT